MLSRQDDGQDEVPPWTRLGTFAGGELAFVRELLRGEGIVHHEEFLPGRGDGAVELWVTSLQQARAVALLAEAQTQAADAAYRETAVLAAERKREATAAARAAAAEARATTRARRRAAHKESRRVAKHETRRLKLARSPMPWWRHFLEHSASERTVRIVGGLLAALILALVLIGIIGERYGSRAPLPGHNGKTVACKNRFQVICF